MACECKTRRLDVTCDQVRGGLVTVVPCDAACAAKIAAAQAVADEAVRLQRLQKEEKDRQELLEYEKKFGPRKYKERKQQVIEENAGYSVPVLVGVSGALVVVAIAIALYMDFF